MRTRLGCLSLNMFWTICLKPLNLICRKCSKDLLSPEFPVFPTLSLTVGGFGEVRLGGRHQEWLGCWSQNPDVWSWGQVRRSPRTAHYCVTPSHIAFPLTPSPHPSPSLFLSVSPPALSCTIRGNLFLRLYLWLLSYCYYTTFPTSFLIVLNATASLAPTPDLPQYHF